MTENIRLVRLPGEVWNNAPARRLLIGLVGIDLFLILVTFVFVTLFMFGIVTEKETLLLVFDERGLGSDFTFLKWLFLIAAFGVIAWRYSSPVFAVLTAFFVYVFLDDSLELHERVGFWMAEQFGLPSMLGIQPDSVGQLVFFGAVGGAFAVFLGVAMLLSSHCMRVLAIGVFIGLASLAVFGVFLDALHAIVEVQPAGLIQQIADVLLAIIEDGGEMIVGSILCAYAATIVLAGPQWEAVVAGE